MRARSPLPAFGTDLAVSYKLYIGKTNSLADRLNFYLSDFQPHSPNDFKLRVFASYLNEIAHSATMDLHFKSVDVRSLTEAENDAVRRYDPILNKLPQPSLDARNRLREAFELYYRSALEQRLREPT